MRHFIVPGETIVHVGARSSAWTSALRAVHPGVHVFELQENESVDSFRERAKLPHIETLAIERAADIEAVVRQAPRTLANARVDAVHFRLAAGEASPAALSTLREYGYRLLRVKEGSTLPADEPLPPGSYLALNERLVPLVMGGKKDFDLLGLCIRHQIEVKGVLHVGAHEGKEIETYERLGAKAVLFVEANPAVHARLAAAMAGRPGVITVSRAISDRPGRVTMHLASFDQSSSLLPMQRHLEVYPQIVPAGTIEVDACTLDQLVLEELRLAPEQFTLLNIDVQGAEALVLKGATRILRHVNAINVEVSFTDLYRGGALIEDIESLLGAAGFRRVALLSPYHATWGDAFYVRSRLGARDDHPRAM
jgi:FkbM family methyltransferase